MRIGWRVGGLVALALTAITACGKTEPVAAGWAPVSSDAERAAQCVKLPDGVAKVLWSGKAMGVNNSRVPGPTDYQMDGIAWLAKPGAAAEIMQSGKWDPAKLPADRPEGLGISDSSDGWFHARPPEDGSVVTGDLFYFNASENAVYFSVVNPNC